MKADLRLVAMAGRDIDAVRSLDELAYPNPWSAATWRNELSSRDRVHLIALDGDELVGHAGLLFVLDEVHVTTVAVAPHREGNGIGSRLVVALLDEARVHGSTAATLEVRAAHQRTQRLYARFGFRPAGLRRDYYSDPADDAIVMWLHDLDGAEAKARIDEVAASWRTASTGGSS